MLLIQTITLYYFKCSEIWYDITLTIFNKKEKLKLNNDRTSIVYFMNTIRNVLQFVFKFKPRNNIKRYLLMLLFRWIESSLKNCLYVSSKTNFTKLILEKKSKRIHWLRTNILRHRINLNAYGPYVRREID